MVGVGKTRMREASRACRRHEAGECPPSLDATKLRTPIQIKDKPKFFIRQASKQGAGRKPALVGLYIIGITQNFRMGMS